MAKQKESTENSAGKVRGKPFMRGDDPRRNMEGRPLGSRNFSTDFNEAIDEIAKANNITNSEARKILLKKAYGMAKDGNFPFWKELVDREYGKVADKIEHSGEIKAGKELTPEQIAAIDKIMLDDKG